MAGAPYWIDNSAGENGSKQTEILKKKFQQINNFYTYLLLIDIKIY